MNLKKKFVIGAASLALVAGMGVAPAMAAMNIIKLPNGYSVNLDKQRLAGDSRVETSLAIAKKAFKGDESKSMPIYVVGYDGLVDAATAGMIDNNPGLRGPIVALPKDVTGQKLLGVEISKVFTGLTKVVAIGGTATVPEDSLKGFAEYAGISSTDRWGGKDRYETNVTVAQKVFASPARAYLASGVSIVDALTAGTLTNGPVLLVPTSGDVSAKTKSYVAGANLSPATVAVIGGTSALSDEQASKIFPDRPQIDTTPWTAPEILDGLQDEVQTAAILYLGQKTWQQGAKDGDGNLQLTLSEKDANKPYEELSYNVLKDLVYFGLGDNTSNPTATEDRSKINSDAVIPTGKEAFAGYYNKNEEVKGAAAVLANATTGILAKKHALETAISVAAQADIAADEFTAAKFTKDNTKTEVANLYKALVDLYGKAAVDKNVATATTDATPALATSGMFTFAPANGVMATGQVNTALFKGMDQNVLDGLVAAAEKSSDKVVVKADWTQTGTPDMTLAKAAEGDAAAITALFGTADGTGVANKAVNMLALENLVNARAKQSAGDTKDAHKGLIDAVRAYYTAKDKDGTVQSSQASMYRLAGANRYETSAYVSVFQSKDKNASPFGGEGRTNSMKEQYLASGGDAFLIDSVFAGQLTKGTILLVPPTGDVDPLVKTELKRKGTKVSKGGEGIFPADTFTAGGKNAVSDEVFTAAMNALGSK